MTDESLEPVASWQNTAILIAILLATAVRGATMKAPGTPNSESAPVLAVYVTLIAAEGALLYLVARGIRRSKTRLRDLVGGRWQTATDILRDVVIAAAFWGLVILVAGIWHRLLPSSGPRVVATYLPHTALAAALWVLLSVIAGIAEEIVFRGYLQRQFTAWLGNRWIALVLQAVLFGISHGYQGVDACIRITVLGAMFGALALWRRSLRPGIIAHAWTDIAGGLLRV